MLDFDIIETPENVELQRPLAGIGSRLTAGLIDNLIIFGVYLLIFLVFLISGFAGLFGWETGYEVIATVFIIVIAFCFYWGYFFFFEMYTNGQSPGKKIVKIRVVQEEGQGISFTSIAIRNLLRAVDGIGLYSIAGISMFLTGKIQRLGDLAAGTLVVTEQTFDYSGLTDKKTTVTITEDLSNKVSEMMGLTREEYRLLQHYWIRRNELSIEARQRLLPRLMKPIFERSGEAVGDRHLGDLEDRLEELMRHAVNSVSPPKASLKNSALPKDNA